MDIPRDFILLLFLLIPLYFYSYLLSLLRCVLWLELRTSQFSSVAQLCLTLCDPMDCSKPGFLSITSSHSLLKLMSIELVMPFNHFILRHPLLLLASIIPSIRAFSNGSVLHIRWPKYTFGIFQLKTQKSSLCVHSDFPAITMLCRLESD